jgi:hypothetical protein
MQSSLFTEREGEEGLPITCNVNVVIAFEDATAGKYADHFYDRLKERLGVEFEFTRYQWSFALLQDPGVRDAAAQDAAMADIVIIATHGDSELPEHVDYWFQAWVGRNANPMALVALFDQPAASAEVREEVRSSLARVAQTAGMDFFAEPEHGETQFVNRLTGKM